MSDCTAFQELGVSERFVPALSAKGFENPTAIQKLAIPLLLSGEKDLIGQALTGTGKTAAFGLPVLQELERSRTNGAPGALILSPTRELSLQIAAELDSLQTEKRLRIVTLYGGQPVPVQLSLLRRGVDIAVGTPGRIMDLHRRGALKLDQLRFAVLDEADEMLDMGFVEDIREILQTTNADKRMLMFSATMPQEIMAIAETFMRPGYQIARAEKEPVNLSLTEQYCCEVRREEKLMALTRLIDAITDLYALVFCRTRADVDEVTEQLTSAGIAAEALHGEISQAQRLRVIEAFKKRKFPLLIATDVAARGIDVNDLSHVINYSLPQNSETYIHRIGRTGRAGKHGVAISFFTSRERRKMKGIEHDVGCPIPLRKLPEVSEIVEAKKQALSETIVQQLAEEKNYACYLDFAEELCTLAEHPAQIVSLLLQMHFGEKLLRPAKAAAPEWKKLLLFAGRATGLTLPDLLREIADRAGVRGGALGKITCRADKTWIEALPADAERILRAFKHDENFRFKMDDGRDERKKKERRETKQPTGEAGKSAKPFKRPKKPLREEFMQWISETDE